MLGRSILWALALFVLQSSADCPQASSSLPKPGCWVPSFNSSGTSSQSLILPTVATTGGPISSPSFNSRGVSSQSLVLPTVVTTGGPISTATDAFATSAPPTTTFSYSGGALTYTRETISDLSTVSDPTTVTATITKTSVDGSLATYIGPILVGHGGTWWGPPGTAPVCIWPFCLTSGPPGAGSNGADGGGGAGFTGAGTPSDSTGGNGGGAGGGTGGVSGGGSGGGSGGSSGGDGGEGSNGEPAPQACPGAGAKLRRSNSILHYITNDRLVKRAEELTTSTNPLKDAFNAFGFDKSGNSLASGALDSAEIIITNKFPEDLQNAYVTGLNGHYTLPQKLTVGTGDNTNTFASGQSIYWQVRWDYDPEKGPHVNAQFGSTKSTKFAYQLARSQFQIPTNPENSAAKYTMSKIMKDLNSKAKYDLTVNMGKQGEPNYDLAGGKQNALNNLKEAWKAVANAPCT
ncbi:MAG: hypothetical protein ASARMPRED_009287 [Alectoria sarmentosa]|nr:MAG: hypothetical protein ASARMPRED_009287 [Alectoria sarmentosa]